MAEHDRVLIDLTAATLDGAEPYGMIENAAIAIAGSQIAWVGPRLDLPRAYRHQPTESLGHRLVTPGLIDCHTHIVHGGDRAREFEMRLEGASYEEVARAGAASSQPSPPPAPPVMPICWRMPCAASMC